MPLFRGHRTSGKEEEEGCPGGGGGGGGGGAGGGGGGGRQKRKSKMKSSCVSPLTQLCLLSLAHNMDRVWVKDYADNYLDKFWFRHIMGPFNVLPGPLVEELTQVLSSRKQLSRAALHLLLVPQLHSLSLAGCPGLVNPGVCSLIAARCQVLSSLDLSGAQQLPAQAQCAMLSCLPGLRSVLLAGTPCDRRVICTLVRHCRALRHLDVSRCHLLSPAALLPLGGTAQVSSPSSSSSSSSSAGPASTSHQATSSSTSSCAPLPLCSLLALDIGFGEEEGDPESATAYLLLALPGLQRAAMEGLARACCLIHSREFGRADGLTAREELPRLEEVWRERRRQERTEGEEGDEGDERAPPWVVSESESESEDEGPIYALNPPDNKKKEESFTLRLREIQGLSFSSLEAVGRLCPDVCSVTLDYDGNEDNSLPADLEGLQVRMLALGLQRWGSGQLRSLAVRYPHALSHLLPSVHLVSSHLSSLTLEGVKTGPQTPLLELLGACPRLRELSISAEPSPFQMEEAEEEEEEEGEEGQEALDPREDDEGDLPRLLHLRSLSLNFSYEHSVMKPVMYWRSLQRAIKCLLSGSPQLEKVSLVALPCPLNSVLRRVLLTPLRHPHMGEGAAGGPWSDPHPAAASSSSSRPLGRLQQLCVSRTDVTPAVVRALLDGCRRLRHLDLTCCWKVHQASMSGFHRETLTVLWR